MAFKQTLEKSQEWTEQPPLAEVTTSLLDNIARMQAQRIKEGGAATIDTRASGTMMAFLKEKYSEKPLFPGLDANKGEEKDLFKDDGGAIGIMSKTTFKDILPNLDASARKGFAELLVRDENLLAEFSKYVVDKKAGELGKENGLFAKNESVFGKDEASASSAQQSNEASASSAQQSNRALMVDLAVFVGSEKAAELFEKNKSAAVNTEGALDISALIGKGATAQWSTAVAAALPKTGAVEKKELSPQEKAQDKLAAMKTGLANAATLEPKERSEELDKISREARTIALSTDNKISEQAKAQASLIGAQAEILLGNSQRVHTILSRLHIKMVEKETEFAQVKADAFVLGMIDGARKQLQAGNATEANKTLTEQANINESNLLTASSPELKASRFILLAEVYSQRALEPNTEVGTNFFISKAGTSMREAEKIAGENAAIELLIAEAKKQNWYTALS